MMNPDRATNPNLNQFTVLTVQEAEPLLRIISRLGHIVVVKPSPYLPIGWPHICWLSDPNVDAVNSVMWKFSGNAFWYLLADMPRTCLVAEVRADALLSEPVSPEIARLLLAKASADLPKLADFLEETLELKNTPSLGYELSEREIELPLVEDRIGAGRPVVIAAEPDKYASREGVPTSDLDRTIHFWITDEEYDGLFAILGTDGTSAHRSGTYRYPVLGRIISGYYQNVAIRPDDVRDLSIECQRLKSELSQSYLSNALSNVESVCHSAMNYKLGICIPGG